MTERAEIHRSAAAAVVAHQADNIQEDVDEVQIQGQRAIDGSLFGHFSISGVVAVHLLQLLGIVSGQRPSD